MLVYSRGVRYCATIGGRVRCQDRGTTLIYDECHNLPDFEGESRGNAVRAISRVCLCAVIIACLLAASIASRGVLGTDANSGWGIAQLIEIDDSGDASDPMVAVDDSGNATAVWIQSDGSFDSVWSSRYVVGIGWGLPTLIEANPSSASHPQVGVDDSGNAIAIWRQSYDFRISAWSNRYVVGTGWGEAEVIETNDTQHVEYPQLAVDSSGNAIAMWHQWEGETQVDVWYNRFVVGSGWSTAEMIDAGGAEIAFGPHVAFDGSGDATAVWQQWNTTRADVWSNRYVAGTGWGEAQLIETDTENADQAQVAVDSSGNAIVVWRQNDTTRSNIESNRFVIGTGWGTATLIETDNAGSAEYPKIAVDASGDAIAVWRQSDGTLYNIWSNRYSVGTGWGTATLIETDDAGHAGNPQVAVDDAGNAIAVWQQYDGDRESIYSNRYVVGTGWSGAQCIETENWRDAGHPHVAVDDSGNATAVWEQDDGTRWNIWSNRYVVPDTTPPSLSIDAPLDGLAVESPAVTVSGTTEPGVDLTVNGMMVAVGPDGSFSCMIALVEGVNAIVATATDASDNSATVTISVTYVNPIHELEEELDDALDELNTTKDDLEAVMDELDAAKNELNAIEDDLASAEEELSSTSDDLSDVKSQNTLLMAVLAVFAILAVVMTIMFLSLRKKMADLSGKSIEEETPPPPQS